jgi:hypothetical protein
VGVAVCDVDLLARAVVVALVELLLGERGVGLGEGELARRAAVGAVVPRLLDDLAQRGGPAAQLVFG